MYVQDCSQFDECAFYMRQEVYPRPSRSPSPPLLVRNTEINVIRCPPNSSVQGGKQTNKETKNSNWKHILKKESNINANPTVEKSGSCLESTGSCCTHHKWHFFLFFLEWDIFHWWLIQCRRHNIRKTTGFWKLRQNFSSKRYSNGKN